MSKNIKSNALFKIEKGIPDPLTPYGFRSRFPFGDMEIGDSFKVPDFETFTKLYSAASWYGTRNMKKFRCSQRNGDYRCWRIA